MSGTADTDQRPVEFGLGEESRFLGELFFAEFSLGTDFGILCAFDIDILTPLPGCGEQMAFVVHHRAHAPDTGCGAFRSVLHDDVGGPHSDSRAIVDVPRKDGDIAVRGTKHQTLYFPFKRETVHRDNLQMEKVFAMGCLLLYAFLAFSNASSMEPTKRNALSGRLSHSPSRIMRKPRSVSLRGTYLPGMPVNCSATEKLWDR